MYLKETVCLKSEGDYSKLKLDYIHCSYTECPCHSQFVHSSWCFSMILQGIHSWLYKQYWKEICIYKGYDCQRDGFHLHLVLHIYECWRWGEIYAIYLGVSEAIHTHSSTLLEYECNKHVTVGNVCECQTLIICSLCNFMQMLAYIWSHLLDLQTIHSFHTIHSRISQQIHQYLKVIYAYECQTLIMSHRCILWSYMLDEFTNYSHITMLLVHKHHRGTNKHLTIMLINVWYQLGAVYQFKANCGLKGKLHISDSRADSQL